MHAGVRRSYVCRCTESRGKDAIIFFFFLNRGNPAKGNRPTIESLSCEKAVGEERRRRRRSKRVCTPPAAATHTRTCFASERQRETEPKKTIKVENKQMRKYFFISFSPIRLFCIRGGYYGYIVCCFLHGRGGERSTPRVPTQGTRP